MGHTKRTATVILAVAVVAPATVAALPLAESNQTAPPSGAAGHAQQGLTWETRDAGWEDSRGQVREPADEMRARPSSGFDASDAGIRVAAIVALLGTAGGLTLLAAGRRRRRDVGVTAH